MALKIEVQAENFQEKGTVYLSIARGESHPLRHKNNTSKMLVLFFCYNGMRTRGSEN